MKTNEHKTNNSNRSKLAAAAAMLLLATIMVVSTSYAWFTLSTTPVVSDVTTAVGANGALEMRLLSKNDDGSWFDGEGMVPDGDDRVNNLYWGNLVNLSHEDYGSQAITMYPSLLNILSGDKIDLEFPIRIPTYSADGRVKEKNLTDGGIFAKYNGNDFMPSKNYHGDNADYYGFRGIGVASGLSQRQKDFNKAVSAMTKAQYDAQTAARSSLSNNGTALAKIAIAKAMQGDAAKYYDSDVAAINSMITGLEASLNKVEEAYIQAVTAMALSLDINTELISNAVAGKTDIGTKIEAVLDVFNGTINKSSLSGYDEFEDAVENINDAKTAAEHLTASEFTWSEIESAISPLVNVSTIEINGHRAENVNNNKDAIAEDIIDGKGIKVTIPTDGGIYADIADLCGNYSVDITVNTGDFDAPITKDMNATMTTASSVVPSYLKDLNVKVAANKPDGGAVSEKALSEMYGYVIDLAFRSNATQSNLLLQSNASDRIYENNNNEETMGKGSTMTFKSGSSEFTTEDVKKLMSHFRVVFYDTETGDVYATAKLDLTNNVVEDANGVTADLRIYKTTNGVEEFEDKGVITTLEKDTEKRISALVYLNGKSISNKDVAYNAAQSIVGTTNFQFASSAVLKPMEYGELHTN